MSSTAFQLPGLIFLSTVVRNTSRGQAVPSFWILFTVSWGTLQYFDILSNEMCNFISEASLVTATSYLPAHFLSSLWWIAVCLLQTSAVLFPITYTLYTINYYIHTIKSTSFENGNTIHTLWAKTLHIYGQIQTSLYLPMDVTTYHSVNKHLPFRNTRLTHPQYHSCHNVTGGKKKATKSWWDTL
jgi:hypothetical protein